MIINKNNNYYTPINFQAKVDLKTFSPLVQKPVNGNSNIDFMLKTNRLTRLLEDFSLFLKCSIDNKFFQKKKDKKSETFHRIVNKIYMRVRKTALQVFSASNKKALANIEDTFMKLNPDSPEYIEELAKIGNSMDGKFINTNIEGNPMELLGRTKSATIFVLNHPNFHKDKFAYAIINSILNKMYVFQGRQADCPRPKILVSKNMLNAVGERIGEIYKKLGMISIDASLKDRNMHENAVIMKKLLLDFAKDKVNPFIFPEGRNSVKTAPFEQRMQNGIVSFIKRALQLKRSTRIVPIGIKYTKESDSFGSFFIGKPIYIKRNGDTIKYTHGTSKQEIRTEKMKNFSKTVFEEICENIQYCMKQAEELK